MLADPALSTPLPGLPSQQTLPTKPSNLPSQRAKPADPASHASQPTQQTLSKVLSVFATATDLAITVAEATYLEATAELQTRY